MSEDFSDNKAGANEEPDFEGHRVHSPEKVSDISDDKAGANEEPDFEGHRVNSPEKVLKPH